MTVFTVESLQALPEIESSFLHEDVALAPCTVSCTSSCTFTCGAGSCTHTCFVEEAELEAIRAQEAELKKASG